MRHLEALALAIARENRVLEPDSEAFQTLNPGLLYRYDPEDKHEANESGIKVYTTLHAGLRALDAVLRAKCEGKTRSDGMKSQLTSRSSLSVLCSSCRIIRVRVIAEFLQDALNDRAINEKTPLQYFLEK